MIQKVRRNLVLAPGGGLSEDLTRTLDELYVRLVERYVQRQEQQSRSDDEIAESFKAAGLTDEPG